MHSPQFSMAPAAKSGSATCAEKEKPQVLVSVQSDHHNMWLTHFAERVGNILVAPKPVLNVDGQTVCPLQLVERVRTRAHLHLKCFKWHAYMYMFLVYCSK